jgi:hypothetical protein
VSGEKGDGGDAGLLAMRLVALTWACPMSVATYASWGRNAPVPRPNCATCGSPMGFDGSYPREVREAGKLYRVFVQRARCGSCGSGGALLPDFLLRRRRDTTASVGAAVLPRLSAEVPEGAEDLYAGVPGRTVRSWRRFAERAADLVTRLDALSVEWGGVLAAHSPEASAPAPRQAVLAMRRLWRVARRRRQGEVPPAWPLANVVVVSQLIGTRVDLPWPVAPHAIGRSRRP